MSYRARINVRLITQVEVSLSPIVVLDSSEYSAACDERRAYISGFNGSAGEHINATLDWLVLHITLINLLLGCAVVTLKDAYLFTDGRYFLQAEKQLDQCVLFISVEAFGLRVR